MDIEFVPATITRDGITITQAGTIQAVAHGELDPYETDWTGMDHLLIGVPANHDSVFVVGPYTITLDR